MRVHPLDARAGLRTELAETDPQALGKRYQLTAALPASQAARVQRIPGVQAVAPRYEVRAVDSFSLHETIDVVAYPGDHTLFEAPTLLAGSRIQTAREAEVGAGIADALGLVPGSTLAIELPSGTELRLRVSGIVGSFDHDGRVAYVPAAALLAADPSAPGVLAIRVRPGANLAAVSAALGPVAAPPAARSHAECLWSPSCGRSSERWRSSTGWCASTR